MEQQTEKEFWRDIAFDQKVAGYGAIAAGFGCGMMIATHTLTNGATSALAGVADLTFAAIGAIITTGGVVAVPAGLLERQSKIIQRSRLIRKLG